MNEPIEPRVNESDGKPPLVATCCEDLGFKVDSDVLSDGAPGLSFDFGNVKLEANQGVTRWLRSVVILGGVMTTDRTNTLVHFEMPLAVESFEQGVALVTHCLDSHAGGNFIASLPVHWLIEVAGIDISCLGPNNLLIRYPLYDCVAHKSDS